MVDDLSSARLMVLDGLRHMTTIEAPLLVNQALEGFFRAFELNPGDKPEKR